MRIVLFSAMLVGCAGTGAPVVAPTDASPSASASASASSAVPSAKKPKPESAPSVTGIPACDEYLVAYEACRERLRPEEMAGDRPVFESHRAHIEMLAREGDPQLAIACRAMHENIRAKCTP